MAQFLQDFTGPSTGVYIGKLERPRKKIGEMDDDKAHVDKESSKLVRFHYSSKGHEFMKGKLLKPDQGITHSVFKAAGAPGEGEPAAEEGGEEGEGAEGEAKAVKVAAGNPDDILNSFKHVYIRDVVREPKMHFYRVPRLGAFMVVPLEYESCLSTSALDAAIAEHHSIKAARIEQDKLKAEWDEEQAKIKEEKEKAGESYEPEKKEWEALDEKSFVVKKKQYVVCLDTLG